MQCSDPACFNSLLWCGFLILSLCLALALYWWFGKAGLYCFIVAAVIAANVQVIKTVQLFGLVATLGNVLYGSVFFATDVLNEVYGKETARRGVWMGFAGMLLMLVWMQIGLSFVPHSSDFSQDALATIFGLLPRIALGSLAAYLVSQHHDVFAYSFWKRRTGGRFLWLRNCASTTVSQAVDSVIFCTIAFWNVFPVDVWVQILVTTYAFKWFVALVDTPFIYLARRMGSRVRAREAATGVVEE